MPYHNDTIDKQTHAMIKTQEDFFKQNIYLSLYYKGSKRVIQGLCVRGSWRPNRNCNILTPYSYGRQRSVFLVVWCSTGGPGVHSAGCWLSLLHFYLWTPTHQGLKAPSAWCGFPYHISSITPSPTDCNSTQLPWLLSWLSYIIVQRPLDFWNRMFDRHQAEITVMQFTGHSLPVHQSMIRDFKKFLHILNLFIFCCLTLENNYSCQSWFGSVISQLLIVLKLAQSAWAVEHTDCFSAEW